MTKDLRTRLGAAYVAALDAQHGPAAPAVHIEIGTAVAASLKAMPREAGITADKMWGFPLVVDEDAAPDSITIHSVTKIA